MSIRVLVVEDEANIADFLFRGLREEGYCGRACRRRDDGLARASHRRVGPGLTGLVASRPGWLDAACSGSVRWAGARPCCS